MILPIEGENLGWDMEPVDEDENVDVNTSDNAGADAEDDVEWVSVDYDVY